MNAKSVSYLRLKWLATPQAFLLLALVFVLMFQGLRGIWEPDEARYTTVALEMLESGDWVTPRLHHERERWEKPPMTYWLIASSISIFGQTEFAARLPNALAWWAVVALMLWLGRLFVPQQPWLPGLVYATMAFPFFANNLIITDSILASFEVFAVSCYLIAQWGGKPKVVYFMWLGFGLAFLTKGPPALLPLVVIILSRFIARRQVEHVPLRWMAGLGVFVLIASPWFLLVVLKNLQLMGFFLWDELVLRIFSGHHQRHSEWYGAIAIYLPVFVLGTLPWSWHFVRALAAQFFSIRNISARSEDHLLERFLLLWIAVPLAIFLISQSRQPLYVLPLFAPISLLVALYLQRIDFQLGCRQIGLMGVWALLLLGLKWGAATIDVHRDARALAAQLEPIVPQATRELVFAGTRAYPGLSFYMDVEVEQVGLAVIGESFESQVVNQEIAEDEAGSVWLVPENEYPEFLRIITTESKSVHLLGVVDGWKTYKVLELR